MLLQLRESFDISNGHPLMAFILNQDQCICNLIVMQIGQVIQMTEDPVQALLSILVQIQFIEHQRSSTQFQGLPQKMSTEL